MLVFRIIEAGPNFDGTDGTANFSPTLPNDTPSSFSNPIAPSKIGAGPVIPARASSAAYTPSRAAFAKATPFQCDNSPTRAWRKAAQCTPAMLIAWRVRSGSSFINFAQACAVENAP